MPDDPKADLKELDSVVSALAHPARRQILMTIHFRGGGMTAGDIAGRFAHAWPTTTRHLKVLESAGLLEMKRDGRTRVYTLNRAKLQCLSKWISWFSK